MKLQSVACALDLVTGYAILGQWPEVSAKVSKLSPERKTQEADAPPSTYPLYY